MSQLKAQHSSIPPKAGPEPHPSDASNVRPDVPGQRRDSLIEDAFDSRETPSETAFSRLLVGALRVVDAFRMSLASLGLGATVGSPLPHPVRGPWPVILIGGMGSSASEWDTWKRSLGRDGFEAFVYNDPEHELGDVATSAERLSKFIAQTKAATGAKKVTLVGYSSGGLTARTEVELENSAHDVAGVVQLATSNQGDDDAPFLNALKEAPLLGSWLDHEVPRGELDEQRGSPLLRELRRKDGTLRQTPFVSIYSRRFDGLVEPPNTPWLEHAQNIVLDDAQSLFGVPLHDNHYAILHNSDAAYEAARAALIRFGGPQCASAAGWAR